MDKMTFIILSLHVGLLAHVGLFYVSEPKVGIKHLVVNQFTTPGPKPVVNKPKAATPPLQKRSRPPKPEVKPPIPAPKKVTSAPAQAPLPAPKKTQTAKRSPLTQELLQELEESIAKIEGKHDKVDTRKQLATPHSIEIPNRDKVEENYADALISCLRGSLHLPDYGEVKLEVTLKEDGSVEKVVVLKADSEKNRNYLETHLPHLKFPAVKKPEHTFVLTFCNEV
jgi:hypothetical protein